MPNWPDENGLRSELEDRGVGYVLAIGCDRRILTETGTYRADALAKMLATRAWQRLSAGKGSKGHRYYDRGWVDTHSTAEQPGHRWLLIRRNRRTGELAFYRCYAPKPVTLATLVRVARRRWTIEQSFQTAKGQTGLDEHQVQTWTSWYRWTTLVMLAHLFLTNTTVPTPARPTPAGVVPLALNEIRHLFAALVIQPSRSARHMLRWTHWRRQHQHRARQAATSDNPPTNREHHDLRLSH